MDYTEVQVSAAVDSGDLMGMLRDIEPLGAWESEGVIHLFWPADSWSERSRQDLEQALVRLGIDTGAARITIAQVEDQDWNARWVASVQPVQIGRRVLIRQSWNAAIPRPGGFALIIDPKRAFGTGYHATTQLLVEWLEDTIESGERVLDVGTGSGILAMVALRLGARSALAIDNDPVAIECARENAMINSFGSELQFRTVSLNRMGNELFDLVVANLDRRAILDFSDRLIRSLRVEGRLLVSGILMDDATDASAALASCGGEVVGRREREEWLAFEARLKKPEA